MRQTTRANIRTIPTTSSGRAKRFSDRAELVSQPALRVQNGNTTRKLLHRYLRKRRYSFFSLALRYYAFITQTFVISFSLFFLFFFVFFHRIGMMRSHANRTSESGAGSGRRCRPNVGLSYARTSNCVYIRWCKLAISLVLKRDCSLVEFCRQLNPRGILLAPISIPRRSGTIRFIEIPRRAVDV